MQTPVLVDHPDQINLVLSRMAVSLVPFYRGTAVVMAAEQARQPHSRVMVQLCGDAHLLNFGFYASPEPQLL